jgi:hypothetical protein
MFGLAFRHKSTFGYESTIEQGMPSWFAAIQEKQNSMWNKDLWIFTIISPIMFFSHSHFVQPKDTH